MISSAPIGLYYESLRGIQALPFRARRRFRSILAGLLMFIGEIFRGCMDAKNSERFRCLGIVKGK